MTSAVILSVSLFVGELILRAFPIDIDAISGIPESLGTFFPDWSTAVGA